MRAKRATEYARLQQAPLDGLHLSGRGLDQTLGAKLVNVALSIGDRVKDRNGLCRTNGIHLLEDGLQIVLREPPDPAQKGQVWELLCAALTQVGAMLAALRDAADEYAVQTQDSRHVQNDNSICGGKTGW